MRDDARKVEKYESEKVRNFLRNFFQSLAVFYLWLIPIWTLKSAFSGIEMALERAFQAYIKLLFNY
jgi:hypothetical protein